VLYSSSSHPQNLDVTVTLYNRVRETILDVEQPLIEGQLRAIDEQLERAISELNWTSEGWGQQKECVCGCVGGGEYSFSFLMHTHIICT